MHIICIANCLHVYSKCWNDRYIKSQDEYLHWWDCQVQTSARNICTGILLLEEIEDLGLHLVMLYSFVDSLEFGVAVVSLCVFSRSLDRVLSVVENQMVSALMRNHDADIFGDDHSLMHLQDHHLLAQCNYIHDIIHYIVTLLVPTLLAVFAVDFEANDHRHFSRLHYLEMAVTQFLIHSMFDLFPLLVILCGNPHRPRNGSFQQLSSSLAFDCDHDEEADQRSPCCSLSG